jgi:two-component system, NtrC family, response regulator AtoC
VERIILLEKGDTILEKHLSFLAEKSVSREENAPYTPVIPPQGIILDDIMKRYIIEALRLKRGNKIQAARILGISRSALLYRMEKYGISSE